LHSGVLCCFRVLQPVWQQLLEALEKEEEEEEEEEGEDQ
jgi:hypothetical protein